MGRQKCRPSGVCRDGSRIKLCHAHEAGLIGGPVGVSVRIGRGALARTEELWKLSFGMVHRQYARKIEIARTQVGTNFRSNARRQMMRQRNPTDPSSEDADATPPGPLRLLKRVVILIVGGFVLLCGIALIFLPGPAFLVIPAGLGILALEFERPRVWLRSLRARLHRRRTTPPESTAEEPPTPGKEP